MMLELTPPVVEHFRAQGYPLTEKTIRRIDAYPLPKLDALMPVPKGESYEEVRKKTLELLVQLPPGITQIIFHPADESETLKRITASWRQRAWEARLFDDPLVVERIEQQRIIITDWKELMKRFRALTPDAAKPR